MQLTSRCAEAGRERSQIAKLANGNTLYHQHHTQFMNGVGFGTAGYRLLGFPGVWILSPPAVPTSPPQLQIGHWVVRKSYLYICILVFVFIIITASSSSSMYFAVILNCLYLNPWASPFVRFSSLGVLLGGEGEGWPSTSLVLSCRLPGYTTTAGQLPVRFSDSSRWVSVSGRSRAVPRHIASVTAYKLFLELSHHRQLNVQEVLWKRQPFSSTSRALCWKAAVSLLTFAVTLSRCTSAACTRSVL